MPSLDSSINDFGRTGRNPQALMSQDNIQVTLPDGSKKEVARGTTALDIARSISPRLADAALVAKVKPSAFSTQHSAPEQSGASGQTVEDGGKAPASMHAHQSKDGWQFADLS